MDELHKYVTGVLLQPNQTINTPESSYILSEDAVRKIAYNSLAKFKDGGFLFDSRHDNVILEGVTLVESYLTPIETSSWPKGSWVITVKVENEQLLQELKQKKLNAFSVQMQFGYNEVLKEVAQRLPIITLTKSEDGHSHLIFASVKDGKLDVVVSKAPDGHTHHYMPTESITQEENGHKHRVDRVLG